MQRNLLRFHFRDHYPSPIFRLSIVDRPQDVLVVANDFVEVVAMMAQW